MNIEIREEAGASPLLRLSNRANEQEASVGVHRSEAATALLGMDGYVVGPQVEVDGDWRPSQAVPSDAAQPDAGSPGDGVGGRSALTRLSISLGLNGLTM